MPSPCPSMLEVNEIQAAELVARHEHSRATVIDTVPEPPPGANEEAGPATVASHREDAGLVTAVEVEAELPQPVADSAATPTANSRDIRVVTGSASARFQPEKWRRRALFEAPGRRSMRTVLQSRSPAEHNLSNPFRYRACAGRQLCLLASLVMVAGCAGGYRLQPRLTPAAGAIEPIAWYEPMLPRDRANLARWRKAVGSPVLLRGASAPGPTDTLTVVSWNIALGAGDVTALVGDLRRSAPGRPVVLLLQEAFRSGDDVPEAPDGARSAGFLGTSDPVREIDGVARGLGFSLYYVPSMRNGPTARHREDRGNAILSSVPLERLTAIELPFEHQRRVALSADVHGVTSSRRAWRLRLATVHLDNIVGARHGWIGGEFGRTRQARGLREALRGEQPTVLAGDFNTWFGFADQAYVETALEYPQTRERDRRRTFRGILRLDHVFYRLAEGWRADVRRAESTYGSDHYPLITTVHF